MSNINEIHPERVGKITASMAHAVMAKGRGKNEFGAMFDAYARQLAAERVGVVFDSVETWQMQWGNEYQPVAAEVYARSREVVLYEPGFILHPKYPFIGCTPDYFFGEHGFLEIKCPQINNHVKYLYEGISKEHWMQVQFQYMVTGRAYGDFMTFNPNVPEKLMAKVWRIERDQDFINELLERCLHLEVLIKDNMNFLNKINHGN